MDPQQVFVLRVGYSALYQVSLYCPLRDVLEYSNIGVFVGVEPTGL